MSVQLSKVIIPFLYVLVTACTTSQKSTCLITRAAFDIGSGSTKMKVYTVNTCKQIILSQPTQNYCNYSDKVAYKESLLANSRLTQQVIDNGVTLLARMKADAIKCGATQFQATATSAFRQAPNGKQAVKQLESTGINISLISQEEEARLGFTGAADKVRNLDSQNLCVWDIGGSSMQITCTHNGKSKVFLGHLASIPFKEHILELQSSNKNSPNPINSPIYQLALKRTQSEANQVFKKINRDYLKNKPMIGVGGVHFYAVSKAIKKESYSVSDLEKAIKLRLNKNNRELGGGKYANTALSNIILVKGMMESLGIPSIKAVKAIKINLTEGLVLSNQYW